MRAAFIQTLIGLAERDPRVVLLTGDLGYLVVEPFRDRFPDRFINVGVAEQNMVGIATGLAEAGFIPFIYSIATFAAIRPYEFIRNGPILHRLPVRIVGVGGGVEYGHNGITHWALEDIALMRVQPRLTVVAPADSRQAAAALARTWDTPGPVYYRLGKDEKSLVPGLDGRCSADGIDLLRPGADLLLLATGAIAIEAEKAARLLEARGVAAAVAVVSLLNPAPADALARLLRAHPAVLTVEAHYVNGGLGSLVCEVVAERGLPIRVARAGVRRLPDGISGGQAAMQDLLGLSAAPLARQAEALLAGEPSP